MAKFWRSLYLFGSIAFSCCNSSHAIAADPFTIQLKWVPQAQFIGIYNAKDKGFYEAEGLDVTILHGAPGLVPSDSIRIGRADVVVEWLATAISEAMRGLDLVNVAQIFQKPGLMLVCHKNRGIATPTDLRGRRVSVWYGGNEVPLFQWMRRHDIPIKGGPDGIEIVEQDHTVDRFFDGKTDCLSAMTYNEYWQLLERKIEPRQLSVFFYDDLGFGMIEDGLYVRARRLNDPVFRDRLVRFVRATLRGWKSAIGNPEEALLIAMKNAPGADLEHQRHMIDEVAKLVISDNSDLGLLNLVQFDRTIDLLKQAAEQSGSSVDMPKRVWTHDIWYEATRVDPGLFNHEIRHHLDGILKSSWFYALDLIGTFGFGLAGFLRARERRYNLSGAFVLTALPAVGGGTLRDVLIGGDRSPPFIFSDPTYIYIVFAIVIIGFLGSKLTSPPHWFTAQLGRVMLIADTVGLAAFTIIGAKVAIVAHLEWFWIPICSALTCAGGGILMDIFCGREAAAFRGEIYEEIAMLGGLILAGLLLLSGNFTEVKTLIICAIAITFAFVFLVRMGTAAKDIRSPSIRTCQCEQDTFFK